MSDYKNDTEYADYQIESVGDPKNGWDVRFDGSTYFQVPADSPVVPKVGMTMRLWGRGLGYPVRGMALDGQVVFYRTEAEDQEHRDIEMYGDSGDEWLRRWDAGCTVWSIEMGGLGPGYEQAIQCLVAEIVRDAIAGGSPEDSEAFRRIADKTVKRVDEHLGLSGAQFGAGTSLAYRIVHDGPREMIRKARAQDGFDDSRVIQVSRGLPSVPLPAESA